MHGWPSLLVATIIFIVWVRRRQTVWEAVTGGKLRGGTSQKRDDQ